MHTYLTHEVQVLELRNKITTEARTEMTKEQREYLLRQQMRAIQQELGEKGGNRPKRNSCASGWKRPNCPKRSGRKPSASCRGWKNCLPQRPIIT